MVFRQPMAMCLLPPPFGVFVRRASQEAHEFIELTVKLLRGRLNTGLRAAGSGEYDRPHERTDAIPE
jgi:hypothetical protein